MSFSKTPHGRHLLLVTLLEGFDVNYWEPRYAISSCQCLQVMFERQLLCSTSSYIVIHTPFFIVYLTNCLFYTFLSQYKPFCLMLISNLLVWKYWHKIQKVWCSCLYWVYVSLFFIYFMKCCNLQIMWPTYWWLKGEFISLFHAEFPKYYHNCGVLLVND